ncbi:MAG: hypothetical protein U0R19_29920 [Bryobacteraceae bacterium]
MTGFAINPDTEIAPWRMSWLQYAGTMNDNSVSVVYPNLDPTARYKVLKIVYAGKRRISISAWWPTANTKSTRCGRRKTAPCARWNSTFRSKPPPTASSLSPGAQGRPWRQRPRRADQRSPPHSESMVRNAS